MPAKTLQPKTLFKVEFWEENREHSPVHVEYVYAIKQDDWIKTRKAVVKAMLWRGYDQARKTNRVWLSHLMARDDILMTCEVDEQWTAKQKAKQEVEKDLATLTKKHTCQGCGTPLDDDYCQECGWRQSSWLDRALAKQGESTTVGELSGCDANRQGEML